MAIEMAGALLNEPFRLVLDVARHILTFLISSLRSTPHQSYKSTSGLAGYGSASVRGERLGERRSVCASARCERLADHLDKRLYDRFSLQAF